MKKYGLLLFTLLLFAFASHAQDVITLTNGNTIQAKVLQINPTEITYKDFNNQDGPTITIMKAGVVSIVYANGTKTTFTDADRASSGSFTRGGSSGHSRNGDESRGYYKKKSSGYGTVHGWYFGVGLSLGAGAVGNNDPDYSTSGGTYSGINVLATKMFNPHLGIQFGIGGDGYTYGVNNNATSPDPYPSEVFSQSYLTIPVRVLYLSNSRKRWGAYATAGFDFSVLAGASDQEGDDLSSYYASTLFSPYVSVGVDYHTPSAHGLWMLGPYYKTTVSNAYSGKTGDTWMNPGNNGNFSSIGVTLVYQARFGR